MKGWWAAFPVIGLWLVGCASASFVREGTSGPILWRVDEVGVVTRQVDGKDADAYTFTLVLRENRGTAITFTKVEQSVSEMNVTRGAPSVTTGTWRVPANGEWRIPFPYSIQCPHMPGFCQTSQTVAPSWRLRFFGTNEQGSPIDVIVPVDLPPTTIRTIFK